MIIIDETKLTKGCIEMIGNAYGMKCRYQDENIYQEDLDKIVERFYFDIDEVVKSAMEYIKEEWPSIKGN